MIIRTLCKTTYRSDKTKDFQANEGEKSKGIQQTCFLVTRYGSAKLKEFQESITSAQSSKS